MNTALGEEATGGTGSGSETPGFPSRGDFSSFFPRATDGLPTPMEVAYLPTAQAHKTHRSSDSHIPTSAHTQPQRFNC